MLEKTVWRPSGRRERSVAISYHMRLPRTFGPRNDILTRWRKTNVFLKHLARKFWGERCV
jgi:hypothetical protein